MPSTIETIETETIEAPAPLSIAALVAEAQALSKAEAWAIVPEGAATAAIKRDIKQASPRLAAAIFKDLLMVPSSGVGMALVKPEGECIPFIVSVYAAKGGEDVANECCFWAGVFRLALVN